MLTTLLSLYASAALFGTDPGDPSIPLWQENAIVTIEDMPTRNFQNIAPVIKAKASMALDMKTGQILFEKNSSSRLPIASLTKLMTSLIILENENLSKTMEVSKKGAQVEGSKLWLPAGEKLTVENLLYAALIHSANDAAYTLAENNAGEIKAFVKKMNDKALQLGLYNTKFSNPIGLDEKENYSTAHDLALLSRKALQQDFIRKAAAIKEMEIKSTGGKSYKLKNTNELLNSYLKVLGLKTGTTDEAGQCLIAIIENEQGNQILTIMLGSTARFQETKILADWVFRSYSWASGSTTKKTN
jgi:D-alanyl-D-alanine carboxypeptidase (penicillin-binding protein 5/6)